MDVSCSKLDLVGCWYYQIVVFNNSDYYRLMIGDEIIRIKVISFSHHANTNNFTRQYSMNVSKTNRLQIIWSKLPSLELPVVPE